MPLLVKVVSVVLKRTMIISEQLINFTMLFCNFSGIEPIDLRMQQLLYDSLIFSRRHFCKFQAYTILITLIELHQNFMHNEIIMTDQFLVTVLRHWSETRQSHLGIFIRFSFQVQGHESGNERRSNVC